MNIRVRCKWYDDEGQPLGKGGCRSEHTSCTYVHPSSNEWATAQRRSTATFTAMPPAPRDRGHGRGGFSSPPSRDSGWNNRRKSLNTEWDTEGWKSKPSKAPASSSGSVSSYADPEPSTSKVFGAWGTGGSTTGGSTSGWGDSNDGGNKDTNSGWGSGSGWGAPPSATATKEADAAWGTATGWGTSTTTTATKDTEPVGGLGSGAGWGTTTEKSADGGWGASASVTGTKDAKADGWGSGGTTATTTQDNSSGWATSGWGTTASTATQDNSSGGGWGASGGWASSTTDDRATPSLQPSSTKPTIRPNDLRVEVEDKMAVDVPLPPLSASSSSYRPGSRAPSIAGTPQSAFPPFAVPGHVPTRAELHSGIVKTSVRATCIQLELRELQRQLKAFKATQTSPQFERISTSGGARLDQLYSQLKDNLNSTQKRVIAVEEELVKFPELPSSAPNTTDVDRGMMSYTEDLGRWLRSFMALAVPETSPPAAPSPSAMDVESIPDPKQRPEALLAEIEERITDLEGRLEGATGMLEELYCSETNAAMIDKAIKAARQRSQSEQSLEPTAEDNAAVAAIAEMQSTADAAQQKFDEYAVQVEELLEKNDLGKARIKVLEAERDKSRLLNLEMKSQLEMFEKRKKERALQLEMMSASFARFAKNPNPAPVLDETVLNRVKANVSAMIDNEVIPALKGLGIRYTEAINRRSESLQQSIQPAVDMTSEICQRAEQIEVDA